MSNETAKQKQIAGEKAVEQIQSGMIVGLGHGSTAIFAIRKLAQLLESGELKDVIGIPCSSMVERDAGALGIPLSTPNEYPVIDLTIDGADEIDPHLNLIKGGGGALLREKVVAQASKREIIVGDESKLSDKLGTLWPVPIEVVPFGWKVITKYLESIDGQPELRMTEEGKPFQTDQGNYILDTKFAPMDEPQAIASLLEARAGIVEHGMFLGLANEAIVATTEGIKIFQAT